MGLSSLESNNQVMIAFLNYVEIVRTIVLQQLCTDDNTFPPQPCPTSTLCDFLTTVATIAATTVVMLTSIVS